ncbi:MAG: pro-sigmaK processing inhibitor BofA family protein [Lachnospiraceae bacterium]
MSEIKLWMMQNFGMGEGEIMGAAIIIVVCILVCLISYMKRKMAVFTGFLIRGGVGTGLIFLANYLLKIGGISLAVGIGPISILTSAILGIPGVFLLYGILLI